jgi:hypothetical protein
MCAVIIVGMELTLRRIQDHDDGLVDSDQSHQVYTMVA